MIECVQGQVQVEVVCEPMLDYGATPAQLERRSTRARAGALTRSTPSDDATRAFRLFSDMRMGIEGNRAHGRHTMVEGEKRFCALSWTEALGGPRTVEEAEQRTRADRPLLARLAGRRHLSRPSLARRTCSARRWC